jgi:uncharacterized iron-regulated protein
MKRFRFAPVVLLAVWGTVACALPGTPALAPAPWGEWQTSLGVDRPGAGRIYEVATGRELSAEDLARIAASRRYVLVGEKHDHPDHHLIEAWLVEQLAAQGRRPGVAFEMFDSDQLEALHAHRTDADALARAARWDESGWPAWPLYRPLVVAVLAAGLEIAPASLTRAELAAVREAGYTVSSIGGRLGEEGIEALLREIGEAHCGAVPADAIEGMAVVQIVKDARMAEVLREAPLDRGAVLVAGGGHARRDRGVPAHLRGLGVPSEEILSLGLIEVPATGAAAANPLAPVDRTAFDYVWLTPRVSDLDPCEVFREKLEELRHRR